MSRETKLGRGVSLAAIGLLSLMTLALSTDAGAQTPIDETRPAAKNVEVSIANVSGDVTITGWDRREVHVTGTLGKGDQELIIEGDEERIEIRVEIEQHARNVAETTLNVSVPTGAEIDLSVVSGDAEIDRIEGAISVETVSGDITVRDKPAEVDASSASGDITLLVETDHVEAQVISGDIVLRGVRGDVDAETVSGDIDVEGGIFERFRASSVSGDLDFEGALTKGGSYRFSSHSGDVTLALPADVDADFKVSTFSGTISNQFGPPARSTSRFTSSMELDFSTGSGSASVRAESFSGDIALEKQ